MRRLTINKETVRILASRSLMYVHGGIITGDVSSMTSDCCPTGTGGPGPAPMSFMGDCDSDARTFCPTISMLC